MIEVIQNNNNVLIEEVSPNEILITKNENTITISQVGQQGANGVGVPPGGTTGQVLSKNSNADYDSEWVDPTGGGVSDHGDLTGLGDDDHTQYHNDSRAVTWIATRSTNDLPDSSNKRYVTDAQLTVISNTSGINTGDQDLSGYAQDFTDLGDVSASYTGESDKWVKVNTGETGLEFQDLPIADANTPGLIDAGGQTLSGGKFFVSDFSDADNFSINLASQATVNDTFNNTNSINVGFYPTLIIQDNVDHDGLNVGGLIAVSQTGNGNLNNILGGIAFTAAHEGSGVVAAALGVSGAVNTTAGSVGTISQGIGGSLSVEHEGDGEITTGAALNATITNFGGGDIVEALCVNANIESDGATGDIIDGYVLKCDTHDAINKYGVVIDVPDTKNTLHQLTLKAALDNVPSPLVDGANISVDAALGNIFDIELEGSRTLDNPTNAKDGQELIFRILQGTTGSHTLTLDSKFRFGTTLSSITLSTSVGALDYLTVRYNLASDTFDVVDFKGGF